METENDKDIQVAIQKGEELYKLLKAEKVDKEAIFNSIMNTTNYERQIMNDYIDKNHSKSIIKELEALFRGDLETLLVYMFYSPYELDARLLNTALHKYMKDTKLINEIFSSRPKWYLELIDQEYKRLFKESLKNELVKNKEKNYYKFLLCLFETERGEGEHLKIEEAEKIVDEINKIGLKAYGTNVDLFKKVFVQPSREDFIMICRIYCKKHPKKKDLYQACEEQVGKENKELLKTIVFAICDPSLYFAHSLKKAIVGFGTDTKVLNRVLASRAEIDIDNIRERYFGETGRKLIDDIKGDTSGDYCKFLLKLVNKNPPPEMN